MLFGSDSSLGINAPDAKERPISGFFSRTSDGFDRPTICEHKYLRELRQGKIAVLERRMNSLHIAVHEKTGRLVEGYPVCYSVGQSLDDCFYIESKVVYNIFFSQPPFLYCQSGRSQW